MSSSLAWLHVWLIQNHWPLSATASLVSASLELAPAPLKASEMRKSGVLAIPRRTFIQASPARMSAAVMRYVPPV